MKLSEMKEKIVNAISKIKEYQDKQAENKRLKTKATLEKLKKEAEFAKDEIKDLEEIEGYKKDISALKDKKREQSPFKAMSDSLEKFSGSLTFKQNLPEEKEQSTNYNINIKEAVFKVPKLNAGRRHPPLETDFRVKK